MHLFKNSGKGKSACEKLWHIKKRLISIIGKMKMQIFSHIHNFSWFSSTLTKFPDFCSDFSRFISFHDFSTILQSADFVESLFYSLPQWTKSVFTNSLMWAISLQSWFTVEVGKRDFYAPLKWTFPPPLAIIYACEPALSCQLPFPYLLATTSFIR